MNRINTGEIYTAVRRRIGKSEKGDWEFLVTQDERGYNDIVVFVANRPSGVEEGGKFLVTKINSVSYSNKKDDSGSWRPQISIDADVERIITQNEYFMSSSQGSFFEEDPNDSSLPF